MRSSDRAPHAPGTPLRLAAIAGAVLFCTHGAHAQHLGTIGPVYEIAEPSLLELILAKLRHAQESGLLLRLEEEARQSAKRAIEDPAPVVTLSRATSARSFFHDPSIVVPYAITDASGKVIVAPGTRVNPLDAVSLSRSLLFIDARDPEQLKRARTILAERGKRVKLILTGGSYLELMRRWQMPVYYDQQGALVARLGIRHTPALVSQDNKRLRIDELP